MNDHEQFPWCNLHGIRLVHQFPAACPFIKPDVAAELLERKDNAWAALGNHDGDAYEARMLLRLYEICEHCRLLSHPHVQWLRRRKKR